MAVMQPDDQRRSAGNATASETDRQASRVRAQQAERLLARLDRPALVRHTGRAALAVLAKLGVQRLVPERIWSGLQRRAEDPVVYGNRHLDGSRIITVVSHELTPTGAPKLLAQVVKACLSAGWSVVVVSPTDGPFRALLIEAGATVVISPLAMSRHSPALRLAESSDLTLCNTIVTALLVRHRPRGPLVWFIHETEYIAEFDRPEIDLRAALAHADQVWAPSPMVKRYLSPFIQTAIVVGATVDPPALVVGPGDRRLDLLVLGGIEPRKGQLELAHACALLPPEVAEQLRVTVYGRETNPDYAQRVQEAARSLPFWRYGGALSPDDALVAVAGCDGVIIPSLDEPMSLVALEAMSAGKIVICTRSCGVADALDDSETAFIGEQPTVEELAGTLVRAVRNRSHWAAMGFRARELFRQRFSPEAFGRNVVGQLQAAMGERHADPAHRSN